MSKVTMGQFLAEIADKLDAMGDDQVGVIDFGEIRVGKSDGIATEVILWLTGDNKCSTYGEVIDVLNSALWLVQTLGASENCTPSQATPPDDAG